MVKLLTGDRDGPAGGGGAVQGVVDGGEPSRSVLPKSFAVTITYVVPALSVVAVVGVSKRFPSASRVIVKSATLVPVLVPLWSVTVPLV